MAGRIEGETRQAVIRAQAQARRLGQGFVGCEHLLYGIAGADDAAGTVLRAGGVTPERVAEQVARLIAESRGDGRGAALDHGALDAIGIDLDAVRARVEQAFGPGSLDRAAPASRRGRGRRPRVQGGHLRITRQARKCLERTDGTENLALALLELDASVPRAILAGLGVSAPQLTAEIRRAL